MEGAIFACPAAWEERLPSGVRRIEKALSLTERSWEVLALTRQGCEELGTAVPRCRILLAPGEKAPAVQAERVITYGLSPRDSLTLSSLTEPVLCVQRALPRPDGTLVEPQEFPLPPLPAPASELLPLLGLQLLQMPLDRGVFFW